MDLMGVEYDYVPNFSVGTASDDNQQTADEVATTDRAAAEALCLEAYTTAASGDEANSVFTCV